MANELLPAPPLAQPPSPHATASHVAASMARGAVGKGAVRKVVAARNRIAMMVFIASSDIVKMC